jgi:hypothetical protein
MFWRNHPVHSPEKEGIGGERFALVKASGLEGERVDVRVVSLGSLPPPPPSHLRTKAESLEIGRRGERDSDSDSDSERFIHNKET